MTTDCILFCEDPFTPNRVDSDFETEYQAAQNAGFTCLLFNLEELVQGQVEKAIRKIKPVEEPVWGIYRGWMLTPKQYQSVYEQLWQKNFRLRTSPTEYQNCHYLPDSLAYINNHTPQTVYESFSHEGAMDRLLTKADVFLNKPVLVKDYVKSEKHDWETACYVPDASDKKRLQQTLETLLGLRGKYLNEGLVIREFVPLNALATHSKSGMPLSEEYRLFFVHQRLMVVYPYWEEGEYQTVSLETDVFENLAKQVKSPFFSMDIARKTDGTFTVVELGDGQVSGLPEQADIVPFYQRLRNVL